MANPPTWSPSSLIQGVNADTGEVRFYAPVFSDVEYYIAKPVGNHAESFLTRLKEVDSTSVVFSCNCAVNYVYGELEGQSLGDIKGPITVGEIGYHLLSQTLVALRIV